MSDSFIPAGSLFTASSTKGPVAAFFALYRAKIAIGVGRCRNEWLAHRQTTGIDYSDLDEYDFEEDHFLKWLIERDMIEKVECFDWFISDDRFGQDMKLRPFSDIVEVEKKV